MAAVVLGRGTGRGAAIDGRELLPPPADAHLRELPSSARHPHPEVDAAEQGSRFPIEEFTDGRWRPAIDDPTIEDPSKVRSVLLCSGKIRWELAEARTERGLDGQVAIIALERLYPLPVKELSEALNRYRHVTDVRWVQDEPVNQGAWSYVNERLADALAAPLPDYELNLRVVARPEGAAPSVGMLSVHKEQADDLHERAFEE